MVALNRQIEALLFASDEPLSLGRIEKLLPEAKAEEIRTAVAALREEYETGHAFSIQEISGGYQVTTRAEYAEVVAALGRSKSDRKLSGAALETLAIVAYRQPIKRVDIEAIRGVQCGDILRALMERGLVKIDGRDEGIGNSLLYGTTEDFLQVFGLSSIKDLPRPEEVK